MFIVDTPVAEPVVESWEGMTPEKMMTKYYPTSTSSLKSSKGESGIHSYVS